MNELELPGSLFSVHYFSNSFTFIKVIVIFATCVSHARSAQSTEMTPVLFTPNTSSDPKAEMCESLPGMFLQLTDPSTSTYMYVLP